MPDYVKGGLFVGAAVAVGVFAGFLVPALVVAERETAKGPNKDASVRTRMPNVIGRPLDEAERKLRRRGIAYVEDSADILGIVVPSAWEVCESKPRPGEEIRGTVHVRAALLSTCDL